MLQHLRRMPAPLAVLLVLAAFEALAWGLVVPPLQGPDEDGHVAYVQRIADKHEIPFKPRRGGGQRGIRNGTTTELRTAALHAGLEELQRNPAARPAWTGLDEAQWRRADARLGPGAREDGGFNVSFRNPPLYYAYESLPYLAVSRGSFFDRLAVMRLANVPLMMAVVAFGWLLAGALGLTLAGRTLATALVALQPGLSNLAGVVNPDLLLVVWWTAGLWLMVRLVRSGPTRGALVALVAVLVGAGLTHGRGTFLVVPAAVCLFSVWRRRARPSRRAQTLTGAACATAGLLGTRFLVERDLSNPFIHPDIGQALSYAWQFWLPALPGMDPPVGGGSYGVREAYVERLWGGFAQLEVELPAWAVDVLSGASVVLVAGVIAALVARRAEVRRHLDVLAICVATLAGYLGGLHATVYRTLLGQPDDPILTGRYLLPVLALLACGVAFAVHSLPRRWAAVVGGALLALSVALQINGLGLVIERFYA